MQDLYVRARAHWPTVAQTDLIVIIGVMVVVRVIGTNMES